MKTYGLNELRKMYLEFFESKNHLKMNSFPLVPQNDKSLLLINAGMAPLKPYFTGQETPPRNRVTTCQKCIRTGDIENVGKTARHGTFFEMLGNFSFGDYFKEEAIEWAWEFVTKVMEIPEERLYVSVYEEDDEAEEIWNKKIGVDLSRIFRMGKADNFWELGVGPCGPCSEIYYDRGEKFSCGSENCTVGCDCDRYIEFWNLVFTQFEKDEAGNYHLLENPNIDTGMGLERLAVMMQDVDSIFDVDTIKALRDAVCKKANVEYMKDYKKDVSIRLITDHIRSVTFMASDGILPSNEGRGYVLRRLLRRAARHGKLLGIQGKFLADLSKIVIEVSKDAYPELDEKRDYLYKIITIEEDRFNETIDQGLTILKGYIDELKESKGTVLSGENAFKLYDTYGFPLDLTMEILEEEDLEVDQDAFNSAMNEQRERARSAREESNYMGSDENVYNKLDASMSTTFVGYTNTDYTSKILVLATDSDIVTELTSGDKGTIFVEETPFYATSGGQLNDKGIIQTDSGKFIVEDVKKVMGNKFAHIGTVESGIFKTGETVNLAINKEDREATAKNHSATHILHKVLREVLGSHVEQAGSLVSSDRLRFDFAHFSALTPEELSLVEEKVNGIINESLEIKTEVTSIEEAKNKGAMALFGEKYGDEVRVVSMGDYSIELCGGTHIDNTNAISTFKIVSEAGIAAGVRRIEALTSSNAIDYYKAQEKLISDISKLLKTDANQLLRKAESILEDLKSLQQENEKLKSKLAQGAVGDILNEVVEVNGVKLLASKIDNLEMNDLRNLGDQLKQKIDSGVIVLASSSDDKVSLVAMVTDDVVKLGAHAGNIIKATATIVGGGGGGRPNMAQAGGKNPEKIEEALLMVKEVLLGQLSK
ncbi:alanyl-tRNA synthetase [Natranaerovirga pectinivora]|uniref:Alanine--tRNA ligase n=1 Tax=Natranaerovirga pectinivora TaxID=682400 RepID=A0A4R3MTL4_9FIRM|nr:alanine--tRNA ligase [Natranaerovirga pectinivora]TCT17050.1 alanyl-tRNA synthetase [Natranaerovirga pectinivora]